MSSHVESLASEAIASYLDAAQHHEAHQTDRHLFTHLAVYQNERSHSAAVNMSIDEALFETVIIPTIRFYRWRCPALSFGYFGKFREVAIYATRHDLVRRWTGGGIVFHGDDLTYSIVIPASDPFFAEPSSTIYERIHLALCEALNAGGERAIVAGDVDPEGTAVAVQAGLPAAGYSCFANPVRADVMIDRRKVAGAAQRRTRRGLLQQGSIQGVSLQPDFAERFAKA